MHKMYHPNKKQKKKRAIIKNIDSSVDTNATLNGKMVQAL